MMLHIPSATFILFLVTLTSAQDISYSDETNTETRKVKQENCCRTGMPGPIGPMGPKGEAGRKGEPGSSRRVYLQKDERRRGIQRISACNQLSSSSPSGLYDIKTSRGAMITVYCEMGINGGGYTFIPREMLSNLVDSDINTMFVNKKDVLLRISRPDGSQPYTVISQFTDTGGLSIQVNKHEDEEAPVNKKTISSPFLYLNTLPSRVSRMQSKTGFKSNGKDVIYHNCDGSGRDYFAFFSNPRERETSDHLLSRDYYEHNGVAVEWRKSAVVPPSGSRMPLNFFLFTEMHFGGCGCYTSSERWLRASSPAHGTAIGLR